MAKFAKRKKHSGKSRRRSRVGAMALSPSSPLVKWGSVAAGYLLGDKINAPIDSLVGTKIDGKIIGAAEAGIGYMLALRKGGKKSLPTTIIGGVLLGAGAKRLLKSFGIGNIGGYQMVPAVGGYRKVPAIGAGSMNGANPGSNGMGWNARQVAINGVGDLIGK